MIQGLIVIVLVLAGLLGWKTVRLSNEQAAHAKTEAACSEAKRQAAEKLATATTEARKIGQTLQAQANQERTARDETIEALTRQRDALRIRRLRNNAAAHAAKLPATPGPAGAAQAATEPDGAELPGSTESAEEDEALRADIIRVELMGCYPAYDRARESFNVQGAEQ